MRVPVLIVLAITIVGLLSIIGAFCLYVYGGGFSHGLSAQSQDWGSFGDYFGGVAGPVLGLISIAILGITLLQQSYQLDQQFREGLKQDALRFVGKVQDDLDRLLEREVELSTGDKVPFGDLVDGLAQGEPSNVERYSALLKRLFLMHGQYHDSLKLYKANVDAYFVYQAHSRRLKEVQDFLEANKRFLGNWDQFNVGVRRGFMEEGKL
jgi:uncharacterized membrane protein